jgi:branched-subunit amino acid ABC-type transport system permease component
MVGVGIGGVLVERIFFRPYRGYIYQPFNIALGLSLLISGLALVAFGPIERSIRGIMPGTSKLFGVVASNERLLAMGIASVILFLLWFFVQRVKAGRALRAVAQDMEAASLQGISIDRTCSLSFGIGCALAAGAAAIVGPIFIIDPFIGSGVIMKAMVIVVLGGMGSIPGAILAAFLIGFVESFGYQLIGNIVDMGGFLIVILVLLFKPFGLLGHEEA